MRRLARVPFGQLDRHRAVWQYAQLSGSVIGSAILSQLTGERLVQNLPPGQSPRERALRATVAPSNY
jgi:hypothetical protein